MESNRPHRRRRRKKKNYALKIALGVLGFLVFVAVVAAASAWYMWKNSSVLNREKMFVPKQRTEIAGEPLPSPTPTPVPEPDAPAAPAQYDLYDEGKYYRLRENIIPVLFMGIDSKKNEATDSEVVNGTNQADTLLVGLFNTDDKSVRVLHVPRDTEADVKVLDMMKNYVGTERMHICLQHAYGDGGAMSCELQTEAVSTLLFGIPLDRYVSLGMNGVVKAVNAIGGVEVTLLDDFTHYSSAMKQGATVKLNGQRALVYIRSRQSMRGDQTDQNRMKRQVQFLQAFIATVKGKVKENPTIVLSVYDAVKDYMQTNLTMDELLYLANTGLAKDLTQENLISLPGAPGDEYQVLFHMDEAAARALIIDLFYEEVSTEG